MNPTTRSSNLDVYTRVLDAISSRDLPTISRAVDEVFQPDAVFHGGPPGPTAPEAVKGAWAMLLNALPDIHVAVEDTVTEGDKIVFRNTVTGTHRGEFRGVPPSGKQISYGEIFIVRFADGKVVEIWGIVDTFAQLQQLNGTSTEPETSSSTPPA